MIYCLRITIKQYLEYLDYYFEVIITSEDFEGSDYFTDIKYDMQFITHIFTMIRNKETSFLTLFFSLEQSINHSNQFYYFIRNSIGMLAVFFTYEYYYILYCIYKDLSDPDKVFDIIRRIIKWF